jgi:RNA polymerase sigma factor (sigma-70 family)
MSDMMESLHDKNNTKDDGTTGDAYKALAGNLENLLKTASPRLAQLAQRSGVPPDVVGDIVQETLVAAWQNLAHLRSPEHFESWLDGICRNMSKRWARAQSTTDLHQRPFSSLQLEQEEISVSSIFDIADPQSFDLTETLNRHDLAVLLDRAMNYLPASVRKALEMHYLADLPQREVALQLGMTLNALEVKLHRARRQLRQVLQHELRADAESFGLLHHDEMADQGWHDTSIWCCICGQQRLQGLFELQPAGKFSLRLRCPTCSFVSGSDLINTATKVPFANRRSFRPAFKRVLQIVPSINFQAFTSGYRHCSICGKPAPLLGVEPEVLPAPFYTRLSIVSACPACGRSSESIFSLCLTYPPASQFILQHDRCILEPEELIDYYEQPAIRASICDLLSTTRLTLILHRHTLQLLAAFQDTKI